MTTLFNFLRREPTVSLWQYCLLVTAAAMIPAWVANFGFNEILSSLGFDIVAHSPADPAATLGSLFFVVVFAPIIETLILTWTVTVAISASVSRRKIALISGLVFWGVSRLLRHSCVYSYCLAIFRPHTSKPSVAIDFPEVVYVRRMVSSCD